MGEAGLIGWWPIAWGETGRDRRVLGAMLMIVVAGALPLLATHPAPLQDWPNHLARIHIVVGLLRGDPFWTRFYLLTGFLVPNAVLDLGVIGLAWLGLPMQACSQLFLLATYLVFVGGFCAVARALGAFGPSKPVFAVLLFYNNALFWGLVSYTLGAGAMLCLLAVWLSQSQHFWRRLLVSSIGAVILFFTHAVAAFVWPVLLACFETGGLARRLRSDASCVLAFAIVAVLLGLSQSGSRHELALGYAGGGFAGLVVHKLWAFGDILLGGSLAQDASSVLALLVCAGAVCFSRPRVARAGAVAVVVLVSLALAAPERLGTGSQLDTRLAVLPLVLLAAGVRIDGGRRWLAAMTAAVIARILLLAVFWHAAGMVFLDFRRQAAMLPTGSVMMMAYGTRLSTLSWQQIWSPPLESIATQLVFQGVFVPSIFANPTEQPIALRAPYRTLNQPWDLTDAAHQRAAAPLLAELCSGAGFSGVFLTALYPGDLAGEHPGLALVYAQPDFVILDACRAGPGPSRRTRARTTAPAGSIGGAPTSLTRPDGQSGRCRPGSRRSGRR